MCIYLFMYVCVINYTVLKFWNLIVPGFFISRGERNMPYLSKIQYGDFPVQNSGTKWDKKSPTPIF
jgi:hypothetical protein